MPAARPLLALAVVAAGLWGCSSASRPCCPPPRLSPAAEPAVAPPLRARPAGQVIPVGSMPEGVVVDPITGLVAVGLRDPARLALVSTALGRVVRDVPVIGAPRHLEIVAPGGRVLVPAETADALDVVPLPSGRQTIVRVGHQPHDAAALGDELVVGNELAGSFSVLARGRVIRTVAGLVQPGGVTVASGRIVVVDVRSDLISVYDGPTLALRGRVAAGAGPTHVGVAAGRVYAVDTRGGALYTVALDPVRQLSRLSLPGTPYGIAVDARRRAVWVSLTATNELVRIPLDANGVPRPDRLRRYPSVRQPNTLAVDSRDGRVYVAGRDDGVLEILAP